jgi:hypothetical protein
MSAHHRILVFCDDRSRVPPVARELRWWLAVRSWLACPELLAQDLLDAARLVDRLLGAYLDGRAAQQLLGNRGHRREFFRVWWPEKIRATRHTLPQASASAPVAVMSRICPARAPLGAQPDLACSALCLGVPRSPLSDLGGRAAQTASRQPGREFSAHDGLRKFAQRGIRFHKRPPLRLLPS